MLNSATLSLVKAKCRECGEVKLCMPFAWHSFKTGKSGVNYYCPGCNQVIDEGFDKGVTSV